MHMMAHDLAGVGIGHQTYVAHARAGRQKGDIRHPDLVRPAGYHLLGARLEQIRVTPEAVMTVRGLMVGPAARHQQALGPRYLEQLIPAQMKGVIRLSMEKMLEACERRSGAGDDGWSGQSSPPAVPDPPWLAVLAPPDTRLGG
ncbi:hypothetical protein A6D6_03282 [Alcanivorax xiamenensis]|uniref:Uncharacterized protein n=1 Tax=Alcanivorax xiamenensis TaxID=1177156 RepID=A0ABQ6Y5L4_9GAMM|nr:hypothetical protein A6D6_03282 [Alcanivorax xiamenensis]